MCLIRRQGSGWFPLGFVEDKLLKLSCVIADLSSFALQKEVEDALDELCNLVPGNDSKQVHCAYSVCNIILVYIVYKTLLQRGEFLSPFWGWGGVGRDAA